MVIKLSNGKPSSEAAIRKLEARLGYDLSAPVRAFIRENNGAEPEANKFRIDEKNQSAVRKFIPVEEISEECLGIENLPSKAYPIAWDSFGNYVLVDEGRDGKIYFWDHEQPDRLAEIAHDFGRFLYMLEPFDANSIQLKPGQVKSVWIDPDFMKSLKKR